jgi:hypothetical protein
MPRQKLPPNTQVGDPFIRYNLKAEARANHIEDELKTAAHHIAYAPEHEQIPLLILFFMLLENETSANFDEIASDHATTMMATAKQLLEKRLEHGRWLS